LYAITVQRTSLFSSWNYLYLSQKIGQEKDAERRQALLAAVQQGSVVSWQHVNLGFPA